MRGQALRLILRVLAPRRAGIAAGVLAALLQVLWASVPPPAAQAGAAFWLDPRGLCTSGVQETPDRAPGPHTDHPDCALCFAFAGTAAPIADFVWTARPVAALRLPLPMRRTPPPRALLSTLQPRAPPDLGA